MTGTAVRRLVAMLLLAVAWVGGGVLFAAGPASAHAQLISSDPAPGSHLDSSPDHVTLTFGEGVSFVANGMRLLGKDAAEQSVGEPRAAGVVVTVPVTAKLSDGAYVFVYRVVSADSHPVSGAVSFTVGSASAADVAKVGATDATAGADVDPLVRVLGGVDRWTGYAGVVLAVGIPAFVLFCWPGGAGDRLTRRLTVAGSGLVALTALLALPLQAAYGTGGSLAGAFTDGSIPDILGTSYGLAVLARAGLAVVLPVLLLLAAVRRERTLLPAAGVAAAGLLLTYSWAGHPAVSDYPALTMTDDAFHLGAMATWIGGLVVLAVRLLPAPVQELPAVLRRWSTTAMCAVVALVLTGSVQAWREVRSVSGFYDSEYGRWILAKVAGLVALLVLGNLGRLGVRRYTANRELHAAPVGASVGAMLADAGPGRLALMRRSVLAEVGVAGAVLAATAVLVVTNPGGASGAGMDMHDAHAGAHGGMQMDMPGMTMGSSSSSSSSSGPATGSVLLPNQVKVDISVDPPKAGSPDIAITTRSPSGEVVDPVEVTVTAALVDQGVEPITLPTERIKAGQYSIHGAQLPFPGNWRITITVRTSDVDSGVGDVTVPLH
jgi:copper transport protein